MSPYVPKQAFLPTSSAALISLATNTLLTYFGLYVLRLFAAHILVRWDASAHVNPKNTHEHATQAHVELIGGIVGSIAFKTVWETRERYWLWIGFVLAITCPVEAVWKAEAVGVGMEVWLLLIRRVGGWNWDWYWR